MKKAVAVLLLFGLYISCTKSDAPNPTPPVSKCKIITETYLSKAENSYTYDDSGRVATVHYIGPQETLTIYFSYGTKIIYRRVEVDLHGSTDIITLNDRGQILSQKEFIPDYIYNYPPTVYITNYSYDANGVLIKSVSQQDAYPPTTIDYQYQAGDLIYKRYSSGIIDTMMYDVSKANIPGNIWDQGDMVSSGVIITPTKHLLHSVHTAGVIVDYHYTYDSDGKIVSVMTDGAGHGKDSVVYSYKCP